MAIKTVAAWSAAIPIKINILYRLEGGGGWGVQVDVKQSIFVTERFLFKCPTRVTVLNVGQIMSNACVWCDLFSPMNVMVVPKGDDEKKDQMYCVCLACPTPAV